MNETEYTPLPELTCVDLVAVTYGSKGSALLEHGKQVAAASAVETVPVNTVGAGDAFCAALTLALSCGLPHKVALQTSNAVGAATVGDLSAPPLLLSIEHYITEHDPVL